MNKQSPPLSLRLTDKDSGGIFVGGGGCRQSFAGRRRLFGDRRRIGFQRATGEAWGGTCGLNRPFIRPGGGTDSAEAIAPFCRTAAVFFKNHGASRRREGPEDLRFSPRPEPSFS